MLKNSWISRILIKKFKTIYEENQRATLRKLFSLHPPNKILLCLWNKNFLTEIYKNITLRGFSNHFVIPPFLCSKLSLWTTKFLFLCQRHEKITRGSAEHCKSPSRSRVAMVGEQESKYREAQCIWALRISYFSLKSVILCQSLHNLRIT